MASSHPDHFSMKQRGRETNRPQHQVIIPFAAYGGAIISFALCPSVLVKCRMQVQDAYSVGPGSARYSGQLACALETMKDEGLSAKSVTGLFCGGFATFLRNAVFFPIYENVRHYMNLSLNADTQSSWNIYLVDADIGIARGGLYGIGIYNRAGLKGCYTSLGPTIVRAFPANAAAIVTWELAMKVLGFAH